MAAYVRTGARTPASAGTLLTRPSLRARRLEHSRQLRQIHHTALGLPAVAVRASSGTRPAPARESPHRGGPVPWAGTQPTAAGASSHAAARFAWLEDDLRQRSAACGRYPGAGSVAPHATGGAGAPAGAARHSRATEEPDHAATVAALAHSLSELGCTSWPDLAASASFRGAEPGSMVGLSATASVSLAGPVAESASGFVKAAHPPRPPIHPARAGADNVTRAYGGVERVGHCADLATDASASPPATQRANDQRGDTRATVGSAGQSPADLGACSDTEPQPAWPPEPRRRGGAAGGEASAAGRTEEQLGTGGPPFAGTSYDLAGRVLLSSSWQTPRPVAPHSRSAAHGPTRGAPAALCAASPRGHLPRRLPAPGAEATLSSCARAPSAVARTGTAALRSTTRLPRRRAPPCRRAATLRRRGGRPRAGCGDTTRPWTRPRGGGTRPRAGVSRGSTSPTSISAASETGAVPPALAPVAASPPPKGPAARAPHSSGAARLTAHPRLPLPCAVQLAPLGRWFNSGCCAATASPRLGESWVRSECAPPASASAGAGARLRSAHLCSCLPNGVCSVLQDLCGLRSSGQPLPPPILAFSPRRSPLDRR